MNNVSHFSGGVQRAWDSTSMTWLKTCPRKYYYSMIMNIAPKKESIHLPFGIAYHSALELYDKMKTQGATHEEATHHAVRFCLGTKFEIEDDIKNTFTLTRSVAWYLEQFKDDPCRTIILSNGAPAVELSFRLELPINNALGEPYLFCGHLDRLVEFNDKLWVLDRKTSKHTLSAQYFNQFNPHNQMSGYTMAARIATNESVAGIIIDAAQIAIGFTRFQRAFTMRTPTQTDEWLKDFIYYIRVAEQCAKENHWPMNDTACSHYGGCPFQNVCSKDACVRQQYIDADFKTKVWNPLETREGD